MASTTFNFGGGAAAPSGSAAPAAGSAGFGSAQAAKPFGAAAPAAAGGFNFGGASAAAGAGAAPATGGFGGAGGFNTAAAGAGAAGGNKFGFPSAATPATTNAGGWGGGGFGTGAATGFNAGGANAGGTSGFQPGGFGTAPANVNSNNNNAALPVLHTVQSLNRQSTLGAFLHALDNHYDALSPKCHFRTFVFNKCARGRGSEAVQRDRYVASVHGGGCDAEAYMEAYRSCPDEETMYPAPLHFVQELQRRADLQKAAVTDYNKQMDSLLSRARAIERRNEESTRALRALRQEEVMLQRRLHLAMAKVEVLRHMGVASDREEHLARQIQRMQQQLYVSGHFFSAIDDLAPYLEEEQAASIDIRRAKETGKLERSLLAAEMDASTKRELAELIANIGNGIANLRAFVQTDLHDVEAVVNRVASS